MRLGIVGVVLFVAAYVASIVLYVHSGVGVPHLVTESPPSSAGTTLTGDAEEIRSGDSLLIADFTVVTRT